MRPEITQIETSRLAKERTPADTAPESPPAPVTSVTPALIESPAEPLSGEQIEELKSKIIAVLSTCFDPEIPVNIYELGLIYEIDISPSGAVVIRMTLTTPACPAAGSLPPEVERKVRTVPGVTAAKVEIVWDPPWDKDRMSEAARLQLGIDD
jgi:FeS assembly SUF system protein